MQLTTEHRLRQLNKKAEASNPRNCLPPSQLGSPYLKGGQVRGRSIFPPGSLWQWQFSAVFPAEINIPLCVTALPLQTGYNGDKSLD